MRFPCFLQCKSEFGNKEFMIWATVSSWSCFCWLYRVANSRLKSNPFPARGAQRTQTKFVRTRTEEPHRDWNRTVFELLLWRYMSAAVCCRDRGSGCGYGISPPGESESEVIQSCLTLSNLMDCSPPGSSVHGILQAQILEWVATSFSTFPMSWLF